jgi:hypothetical protein
MKAIIILFLISSCSDNFKQNNIYRFSILRKLIQTERTSSTASVDQSPFFKYIFLTVSTHNGNFDQDSILQINGAVNNDLNGISEIDQFCRIEKNLNFQTLPGEATEYKALVADSVNRRACSSTNCVGGSSEHIDWVLKTNQDYYLPNKTKIFTTESFAGIINFQTRNIEQILDSSGKEYWTGLDVDFRSTLKCLNWNNSSGIQFSRRGISNSTSISFFSNSTVNCGTLNSIICVRQ